MVALPRATLPAGRVLPVSRETPRARHRRVGVVAALAAPSRAPAPPGVIGHRGRFSIRALLRGLARARRRRERASAKTRAGSAQRSGRRRLHSLRAGIGSPVPAIPQAASLARSPLALLRTIAVQSDPAQRRCGRRGAVADP